MEQREQSRQIIRAILEAAHPGAAVRQAVERLPVCHGRTVLLAVGKAACAMASVAFSYSGFSADAALVITKHGHLSPAGLADLPPERCPALRIREAGHPVPDASSYAATEEALQMTVGLTPNDRVVLLLSGGGSALFEKPLLPPDELEDINRQLLASGADIGQINTIRKRLSAVKGGRFAEHCAPAQVITIALSDVIGDQPDRIASGPAYPDASTSQDALRIVDRYGLQLSLTARRLLMQETPKALPNATLQLVGSMAQARLAAANTCRALGYDVKLFLPPLRGQACDTGRFLGSLMRKAHRENRKLAIVAGGETVVQLGKHHGLGGRNQEMVLAASFFLHGLSGVSFFSLGTDGTDGPTDAAGGWVNGQTKERIDARMTGTALAALKGHNAYPALDGCGCLIKTGPTGTNVNDVCVALVDPGHL